MILVYELKNDMPKYLDRVQDFDPKQYYFKSEEPQVEPKTESEPTGVDTNPVVSTSDNERFKELTAMRAWLRKDLKEEYQALKAKLNG